MKRQCMVKGIAVRARLSIGLGLAVLGVGMVASRSDVGDIGSSDTAEIASVFTEDAVPVTRGSHVGVEGSGESPGAIRAAPLIDGLVAGVLGAASPSRVERRERSRRFRHEPRIRRPAVDRPAGENGADPERREPVARRRRIRWRSGEVTPEPKVRADLYERLRAQEGRHAVVHLEEIPTAEERAALGSSGVKLLRYLGGNAYFAKIEGGEEAEATSASVAVAEASGVLDIQSVETEHKLHPMLLRGEVPEHARFKAGAKNGKLLKRYAEYRKSRRKHHALSEASSQGSGASSSVADDGAPSASSDGVAEDDAADEVGDGEVDTVAVYILFHSDVALDTEAAEAVSRHGGVLRSPIRTINAAVVWVPRANIEALAAEDAVQWIEPPLPTLRKANHWSRIRTQAEIVQAAPYNLDGSGVKVMVYDDGLPWPNHPDFGDRVHIHDRQGPTEPSEHPTHICGSIGGDGFLSGDPNVNPDPNRDFRGVAPGVVMECYAAQPGIPGYPGFLHADPGDLEEAYDDAINVEGVEIINNSIVCEVAPRFFPCEWEGNYGLTCMLIDGIVHGSLGAPARVVWANGNERDREGDPLTKDDGHCGAEYHTTPPPATAKNVISVGAGFSEPNALPGIPLFEAAFFSSRGPTDDGRIKPEICAPGSNASCFAYPTFHIFSTSFDYPAEYVPHYYGTSSAAAFVSGLCALILQDFKAQFPASPLPLNSTLKVLLVHTAADYGTTGPDFAEGYGFVLVKEAIDLMRSGSFLEAEVDQGQEVIFYVNVPSDANLLKATLAWDDVPGAVNASQELVNDLDLTAIAPDGTTYYPWTLDPNSPNAPAVRTAADHINNLEQVLVDNPDDGLWTVKIAGYSVPDGPQCFSIAFTPEYGPCSSSGQLVLDAESYGCSSTVGVAVIDCDKDIDAQVADSFSVSLYSSTEPNGEDVLVTETGESSGRFQGTVSIGTTDAPGLLHVVPGDVVIGVYEDTEDANGLPAVVQDTAEVDCESPVISNVAVEVRDYATAIVTFDTDVPAVGTIHHGTSCEELSQTVNGLYRDLSHRVEIPKVEPNCTHFFRVEVVDDAGSTTVDSNGGACHTFETLPVRGDYFTEWFRDYQGYGDTELGGYSILFTPDGSQAFYRACVDFIDELPTDPNWGQWLPPYDNFSATIFLDFAKVWFYGN